MLRLVSMVAATYVAGLTLISPASAQADDAPPMDTAGFSDCDPLVPTYCSAPFPNDFWLREDPTTETGRVVQFGSTTLPKPRRGDYPDPTPWTTLDGFSPFPQITAHFPGLDLDLTGVPSHTDFSASVADDSPTLLLDAETLEVVAHFGEVDANTDNDDRRLFIMYPAARLQGNHRYIVAMRHFVDSLGDDIRPSAAFAALRDDNLTTDPDVEGRRDRYEDIFERLEMVGWDRQDLTLAWDFHTGSDHNLTKWAVAMRDDALARVGDHPTFHREKVEDNYDDHIARKITGWLKVPLYVDQARPNASIVLDESGMPVFDGWGYTHVTILIPRSLVDNGEAGRIVQYGHGLFGSQGEVESGYLREQADRYGYVMAATDWWGMQWADVPATIRILNGNIDQFHVLPERCLQGFVNQLLVMRLMMSLADDELTQPLGVPTINPELRNYYGNSQGGILGGVYMALSTDVERGVLGVGGASYSLLLMRSKDFDFYEEVMRRSYPDPMDVIQVIGLIQLLWDRADPIAYLPNLTEDPLPNTPSHRVIQQIALQDAQVSNLSSRVFARSIGAYAITPTTRDVYGLEERAPGFSDGNGYYEWDFGIEEAPVENVPPTGEDTHEKSRRELSAQDQMFDFFETGVINHYCEGPCDPK